MMNRQTSDDLLDQLIHDTLSRAGSLDRLAPASDLVTRTMRRLPGAPPAAAARRAARRRNAIRGFGILAFALVAVPAAFGALALARGNPSPLTQLAIAGRNQGEASFLSATMFNPGAPLTHLLFGVLIWLGQVVTMMLTIGIWPRRSAAAGAILNATPVRSFGLGIPAASAVLLATAGLLILLTATLAGLPIAAGIVLIAQTPFILGAAVLTRALEPRLMRRRAGDHAPDAVTAAAAALLALPAAVAGALSALAVLPVLYLVAIPGLGALILSRGGLRPA